jgi:hypothetical protein
MSKIDAMRALREARHAERTAGKAPASALARRPAVAPPAPSSAAAQAPSKAPSAAEPAEELCGHRNMSGRTCTREHGHAAKSHRYS